jgi:hypothetical protein
VEKWSVKIKVDNDITTFKLKNVVAYILAILIARAKEDG